MISVPILVFSAPIIVALIVMCISLMGVVFTASVLSRWMQHNLTYLATFSGGVFLMVVYHLLTESVEESESLALVFGAVLFGAALIEALHHLLPRSHHHHDIAHDHAHTAVDGRRVLLSDALHNVGDGVLLVAAFSVNWSVGLSASIGVVLHELVQEISEFFVLKEAGYSTSQALTRNFLASSTMLGGVLVAMFLSSADGIAILFAGLAAGGFLAVVLRDLLPHALHSVRSHGGVHKHILAGLLGIAVMLSVQTLFGHEEVHEGKMSPEEILPPITVQY